MKLSDAMQYKCVNCSQLARAAKCAPQTISRIVKGVRSPSVKMACKIAKALGARPNITPNGIEFSFTHITGRR